jgi:hypothetical protein
LLLLLALQLGELALQSETVLQEVDKLNIAVLGEWALLIEQLVGHDAERPKV